MSTLTVTNAQVTTLKDASGGNSSIPADILQGRAKVWVDFQGSAVINDSFNVSSITDSGTGKYIVNFSTALGNANYSMIGCGATDASSGWVQAVVYDEDAGTRTTSAISIASGERNNFTDNDHTCVSIFGDS